MHLFIPSICAPLGAAYRVGDEIAVRHPADHPGHAVLDDWPSRNGAAIAAGAAGLCLVAVAVLLLTSGQRCAW